MFKSLLNRMFPITLSRGLEIVQAISNQDSETPEWYGKAVNMFMTRYGNIRAIDVTPQMVVEWSKSLDTAVTIKSTPYSEWSKNSYRRAIRAFFNHLAEIGHIDHPSPTARFRVPNPPKRTPKHVQPEEAERIIQCAQINTRDYAITLMLYDTGCRVSDLATMKLSALHIEEYRSLSHLKEQEKELSLLAREAGLEHMLKGEYIGLVRGKIIVIGKGQKGRKKPRFVFFGDKTARALRDYIKIRPYHAPDDLWLTHTGDPLSIHSFYHAFKQIAKAAGVNCSPHSLRHTFAFRLIRNGADPKIVQELLGHEELSTTMQYYNLSDSELWQAHQEFSKF